MTYKKKLTEVALSLEEIKVAYAREVQPAWASFHAASGVRLNPASALAKQVKQEAQR